MNDIFIIAKDSKSILFHGPSGTIAAAPLGAAANLDTLESYFSGKKPIVHERNCERQNRLRRLILNVAQTCNMECRYCYADCGDYGGNGILMDKNVMTGAVNHILKEYPEGIDRVSFFGGEPFLAFDIIKQTISYINYACDKKNLVKPKYDSICNGTLLDSQQTVDFICENFSNLTISIDGPSYIQNCARPMRNQRDSYELIRKAVEKIKKHNLVLNAAMTISNCHIKAFNDGETLTSWKDVLYSMGFDYVTYNLVHTDVENFAITDEKALKKMITGDVREETARFMNGDHPERFPNAYYKILYAIISKKYTDECGCGLHQIFVTADGEYYPCQFFYNQRFCKVGKIGKLDDALRAEIHRTSTRDNVDDCKKCPLRMICTIWCSGSAVEHSHSIGAIDQLDCRAYKAVFGELLKFFVDVINDKDKLLLFRKRMKEYSTKLKNDFEN
jgi:uncharacterized protein